MLEGFKMTVACYVRVSTHHQKDDGQRAEIQKWLDGNGSDPRQVEWYCDKESGTTLKRPAFDRLQADIFHGKGKCVVLWKLDRLSRRLKDGVLTLADWSERNLRVVVVTQQLDFNGPSVGCLPPCCWGWPRLRTSFAVSVRRRASSRRRRRASTRGEPTA